jgi:hypothetical protein
LTKRDEALHRRVPLLADIPLLGDLFRYDSSQVVRTELLIVLTPRVVRSRYDAERIKQVESARMSWCLSDVVDLHGPAGLRSRQDPMGAAEAEVVVPAEIPKDSQLLPAPTPDAGVLPSPATTGPAIAPSDGLPTIAPPSMLPPQTPPQMLPQGPATP